MESASLPRLRQLLLQEEQSQIADLARRLESDDGLQQRMVEALPEAVQLSAEKDERLAAALQKPVREGVARAVREDVEGFAEALFPVMGPGIRRAIAEALKDFRRSLNYGLGLGLLWRIEAMRRGVSFAELVIERSMPYQVQFALLIQPETGLVISQAEHEAVMAQDSDAFSAMLTAIQDFIRDSFEGDSQISTLELGDRTVWIIAGPKAHLACVISGIPGADLRNRLADVVDRLHARHRGLLIDFHGDRSGMAPVDAEVERCLTPDAQEREQVLRQSRTPKALILVVLLAILGVLLWKNFHKPAVSPTDQAVSLLEDTPGILVTRIEKGKTPVVHGLADPLAGDPAHVLTTAGIASTALQLQFQPYLSLQPEMVLRRVRKQLALPDTVTTELRAGTLHLAGSIEADRLDTLKTLVSVLPGIDAINASALMPAYSIAALREILQIPQSVSLARSPDGLRFAGTAPWSWMNSLPSRVAALPGQSLSAQQALAPTEWQRSQELARQLQATPVFFEGGTRLAPGAASALASHRAALLELLALTRILNVQAHLKLRGYTDGAGGEEENLALRRARAETVAAALIDGATELPVEIDDQPNYLPPVGTDAQARRVDMNLSLEAPSTWLTP